MPSTAKWVKVVLSVGSNIDPATNIEAARALLESSNPQVLRYLKSSPLLRTEPRGFVDQPSFLNCAFLLETRLDRSSLNQLLKETELKLGRRKSANKNSPRTIDLDIVVWGGRVVTDDYQNYDFVRVSVDFLLGSPDHS